MTDISAAIETGLASEAHASSEPRRGHSAALWSGLGFVVGAIFWHFVGFWSFIADIVYNGREDAEPVTITRKNDVRAAAVGRADARIAPKADCISLVIDRSGGETRSARCTAADGQLPHRGFATRGDMAGPSGADAWTITSKSGTEISQSQ